MGFHTKLMHLPNPHLNTRRVACEKRFHSLEFRPGEESGTFEPSLVSEDIQFQGVLRTP
jgi:hypothetical protein